MGRPVSFYSDEHIASAVVRALRNRGAEVLTCVEAGMLGVTDPDYLDFATSQGRVLVTQDQDFLRLHAAGTLHAGIAYPPQGTSVGAFVRGLTLIFQLLESDDMVQHLEYVP